MVIDAAGMDMGKPVAQLLQDQGFDSRGDRHEHAVPDGEDCLGLGRGLCILGFCSHRSRLLTRKTIRSFSPVLHCSNLLRNPYTLGERSGPVDLMRGDVDFAGPGARPSERNTRTRSGVLEFLENRRGIASSRKRPLKCGVFIEPSNLDMGRPGGHVIARRKRGVIAPPIPPLIGLRIDQLEVVDNAGDFKTVVICFHR